MANQKQQEEFKPNPTIVQKRSDIQGLRTVAILAVFFFHMWPQQFPNGYLGVDVFFVISGYLIAKILFPPGVKERQYVYTQPTLRLSAHFYRRRVQRIMPAYALTILATLLVGCVMLIPDFELARLKWDAAWALAFAYNMEGFFGQHSNSNSEQNKDYFEEVKTFRFLTHTWSLGVEVQFYAVAPLLLGVCRWPYLRPLKYHYLLAVAAASWVAQLLASAQVAFGIMPCRLWQFLVGVLSFSLSLPDAPFELLKHFNHLLTPAQLEPRWRQVGGAVADYAMLGGLVALLGSPLHHPRLAFAGQAAVVLLTALLLHRHAHIRALTNRASVELGDLSYLVYLVHWPLLQFLRYRYGAWNVAGVLGISLLMICIGAAYMLERLLDSPLRSLTNFGWLSLYLLAIYIGCLIVILPLPQKISVDTTTHLPLNGQLVPLEEYGPKFLSLMGNGTLDVGKLSLAEKGMINVMLLRTSDRFRRKYSERFDVEASELRKIHESNGTFWPHKISFEGEGRLSILLVGNSHAAQIITEVVTLFLPQIVTESSGDILSVVTFSWRPLYSVFYAFILDGCFPFDEPRQNTPSRVEVCHEYAQSVMALIRRLQPDVTFINTFFSWGRYGIDEDLSIDSTTQQIRAALTETLRHSRLLVLGLPQLMFHEIDGIPLGGEVEGSTLGGEIARRVWFRLPLDELDITLKSHLEDTYMIRQRLEYATRTLNRCNYNGEGTRGGGLGIQGQERRTRCLFVDWAEIFCDEHEQRCRAYDEDTQLSYFFDTHHYSWFGSQRVWPMLQRLGEEVAAVFKD